MLGGEKFLRSPFLPAHLAEHSRVSSEFAAFVEHAVFGATQTRKLGLEFRFSLLHLSVVLIGFGSAAFHGTLQFMCACYCVLNEPCGIYSCIACFELPEVAHPVKNCPVETLGLQLHPFLATAQPSTRRRDADDLCYPHLALHSHGGKARHGCAQDSLRRCGACTSLPCPAAAAVSRSPAARPLSRLLPLTSVYSARPRGPPSRLQARSRPSLRSLPRPISVSG